MSHVASWPRGLVASWPSQTALSALIDETFVVACLVAFVSRYEMPFQPAPGGGFRVLEILVLSRCSIHSTPVLFHLARPTQLIRGSRSSAAVPSSHHVRRDRALAKNEGRCSLGEGLG
jgi:hypothetical protein